MTTTNITNVSDAAWSNNNPNELDYLRPNAFKFQIHNIPNVSYFCQAANIPEINLKLKQKCSEIFLSPVFKVNKSKKILGINRFNLMTFNKKAYFIALGGINEKNYKRIKLLRTNGFASISWAKKNGLRKLRPF